MDWLQKKTSIVFEISHFINIKPCFACWNTNIYISPFFGLRNLVGSKVKLKHM